MIKIGEKLCFFKQCAWMDGQWPRHSYYFANFACFFYSSLLPTGRLLFASNSKVITRVQLQSMLHGLWPCGFSFWRLQATKSLLFMQFSSIIHVLRQLDQQNLDTFLESFQNRDHNSLSGPLFTRHLVKIVIYHLPQMSTWTRSKSRIWEFWPLDFCPSDLLFCLLLRGTY